jgi:hypothetical protein
VQNSQSGSAAAAARRRNGRWARRLLGVAGLAAVVLVYAGPGALAALVSPSPAAADTNPTLRLTTVDGATGFTEPVAGLLPGDVVRRYVDLDGSGAGRAQSPTLTVAATGSVTLRTDTPAGTRGLRLSVSACTGPWVPATGACAGTTTQVLAPTVLGSLPGAVPVPAPGDVSHLQLTLALPDQDETTVNGVLPATTVQGQTARITYTFAAAVTPPA